MAIELKNCLGCQVAPGQYHSETCDHAACPDCGEQRSIHDDDCEATPEGTEGPDRPALWHGVDPRDEVARALNWWTTADGVDRPVEDFNRVDFAIGLGQVTWDRQAQKYVIGEIDEARLDSAIAKST